MKYLILLSFLTLTACGPGFKAKEFKPTNNNDLILYSNCEKNCLVNQEDPVIVWNQIALNLIKINNIAPPKASRILSILHLSIYDALIANNNYNYENYMFSSLRKGRALKETVIAASAFEVLKFFFPQNVNEFTIHRNSYVFMSTGEEQELGEIIGKESAWNHLVVRNNDIQYSPLNFNQGPTAWTPTPDNSSSFLLPEWSQLIPFTMNTNNQFRQMGPPDLSSPSYQTSLSQVEALGKKTGSSRTFDQTQIAKFWAAGSGTITPPGQWNEIAQGLIKGHNRNLEDSARLFALLNLALADAAIVAWDMKVHFYSWRPIVAIQTLSDPSWEPLLKTPNHPDYVSGHSTFSGAASTILKLYFKTDNLVFSYENKQELPGHIRQFISFSQAAEEASKSRVFGGIHFSFACDDGLKAGRELGEFVFNNFLKEKLLQ